MRIGVAPHRLWPDQEKELDAVLQTAVRAEELGFDHVFASGHAVAGELGVTPDPLVLLAAIAGATRRIGLVTSVLVLPLYNPVVLAHQTATLDRLSGGRFTLGVGTGWDTEEYAAVGVPFAGRGRRTDEQLTAVRQLWRGEGSPRLGVLPRTEGGPQVWIGGGVTRRCAGRCGSATRGTAPESTPRRSPAYGRGWTRSATRRAATRGHWR